MNWPVYLNISRRNSLDFRICCNGGNDLAIQTFHDNDFVKDKQDISTVNYIYQSAHVKPGSRQKKIALFKLRQNI